MAIRIGDLVHYKKEEWTVMDVYRDKGEKLFDLLRFEEIDSEWEEYLLKEVKKHEIRRIHFT